MFFFNFNTYSKANGSKYMLNYAAGVLFPLPVDPPIITICFKYLITSGNFLKNLQKLVKEPVFAHVIIYFCLEII